MTRKAIVTGAAGLIGNHLVAFLKKKGYWVRGVDIKAKPDFNGTTAVADEWCQLDLRKPEAAEKMLEGPEIDEVFALACRMGGIGKITSDHAMLTHSNILISANTIEACRRIGVGRLFYSSSACVYRQDKQNIPDVEPLKEEDAWPADPEPGYGFEKLFTEELLRHYSEEFGLQVRVARFHNIFGSHSVFEGGLEKAPAAICRKVTLAEDGDEIEIWGDGKQTRSFLYIDDCLEGFHRLMQSDYNKPINIGSDRMVTIDELVDIICDIAGKKLKKVYNLNAPQGVRGRNSDNTLMREVLKWEPQISLEEGLKITYEWIEQELKKRG